MRFKELAIPDLLLIEPNIMPDGRGFFYESYRSDELAQIGITDHFVQDNVSRSAKGVLRGLHFQVEPKAQAKLVTVTRGEVFDVCVDLREGSKYFGRYVTHTLNETNRHTIYIPKGFAHGFLVMQDDTEFVYKVSEVYWPERERGILWNDPALGIPWPKLDVAYLLSEKDKKNPCLAALFQ
jgi:dTDP-4-dehydrorhamnose 3,5-epimerase